MDLKTITKDLGWDGILSVSDVHAMLSPLKDVVTFAEKHNLFMLFLGDVIDDGNEPFETISLVMQLITDGKAAFVVGNHDDKFYRYAIGKPIPLTQTAIYTLFDVPSGKEYEFLDLIKKLIEHAYSGLYHHYGDWVFAHGAFPETMWRLPAPKDVLLSEKHLLLLGQSNGKRDDRNFPVRLYDWVDDIPPNNNLVVGHDRAPMRKRFDAKPTIHTNSQGGTVYFTDCGSGKNPDGCVCCMVLHFKDDTLHFDEFKFFK